MEKITIRQAKKGDSFVFEASSEKVKALVEIAHTDDEGRNYLRQVGNSNERFLVVQEPLFWLKFIEGAESIEVEVERKIGKY